MQPLQLFFNYRNMREGPIYSLPLKFPESTFILHNLSWILATSLVLGKEVIAVIAINPNSKDNNKYETKGVYVSITNEPMEENYYNSYITDEYKVTSLGYDYPENHIEDWNVNVEKERAKHETEEANAARWNAILEYKDPIVPIREIFDSPHMSAIQGVNPNGTKTLLYPVTSLANLEIYSMSEGSTVKTGFATNTSFCNNSCEVVYDILQAWSRVAGLYDLTYTLNEVLRSKGINISATYGVDDDALEIKVGLWENGMYKYGFPFTSYYSCLEKILPIGTKYVVHLADALRDNDDAISAIQTIIRYVATYMKDKSSIMQAIKGGK